MPVLRFGFYLVLALHSVPGMPVASQAVPRPPYNAGVAGNEDTLIARGADIPSTPHARQLLDLLNGERIRAGLAPLAWDSRLAAAAQRHAQLLAQHQELSHQFRGEPPLSQRLAAVPLERLGENVAVDDSIPGANTALMHSPPHRANILNPKYDAVGIGIVQMGSDLWITQDFAKRIQEESRGAAEAKLQAAFDRARAEAGLPPLEHTTVSSLSGLACSMAQNDRVNSSEATRLPQSRYVVAYTSEDPARLPQAVLRLRRAGDVNRYAAGVCFARSRSYPSGVYWIVLVLFSH